MPNRSVSKVIKSAFPFLVPLVRKYRLISEMMREKRFRKDNLPNTDSNAYPFSSMRVHGAYDKSEMSLKLYDALSGAFGQDSYLPDEVYEIVGMSGRSFRSLLNRLVSSIDSARYLEIGSWKGSTVATALFGNECHALCIDNWSQFGGPKNEFLHTLEEFKIASRVEIIEKDFRSVSYSDIGRFDIFLFDGPHEEIDHYDGIIIPQPALKQEYLLIVDDWNWAQVRLGTFRALSASSSTVKFAVEIRTTEDNTHPMRFGEQSEWHNGCFLAVIEKGARA